MIDWYEGWLINNWLIVGKLAQGMRSCKCTSHNLYAGGCQWQWQVCQWHNGKCVYVSLRESCCGTDQLRFMIAHSSRSLCPANEVGGWLCGEFGNDTDTSICCRSSSAWTEGLPRACRDTKCLSANKHTDQSIWPVETPSSTAPARLHSILGSQKF